MRRVMQGPLNQRRAASQSEQQAGTADTVFVAPSVQQQHPAAVKAWGNIVISGASNAILATGYNISLVCGVAVGMVKVYFTNQMANVNYIPVGMAIVTSGSSQAIVQAGSGLLATGSCVFWVKNGNTGSLTSNYFGMVFEVKGDLA